MENQSLELAGGRLVEGVEGLVFDGAFLPTGEGKSLAHYLTSVAAFARASWYLRECSLGLRVRASRSVIVANMGRVTIGDNAVVAAGSIVTRDVEANAVYAGVPARRVRYL